MFVFIHKTLPIMILTQILLVTVPGSVS